MGRLIGCWGAAAAAVVLVVSACSGGSGNSEPPSAPLPDTLAIATAAVGEAGVAQGFASSAAAAPGLRFEWAFGDGSTSSEAAPMHAYADGGDYTVTLRLSNAVGQSREATAAVSVNRIAHLQGLSCSQPGQGGWCRVAPSANDFDPRSVVFVDDQIGWASGSFGDIRHTRDGGRTWTAQRTGVSLPLGSITFGNDSQGYALSPVSGTVVRTADGGTTWASDGVLPGLAEADFPATPEVTVLSDGALWVNWKGPATNGNRFPNFTSTDGGATWRESVRDAWQASPDGTLWSLAYRRSIAGIAGSVGGGDVFRSTDRGASFQRVLDGDDAMDASALLVFDDRQVLVQYFGNPAAADPANRTPFSQLTQDGGQTWSRFVPVGLSDTDYTQTLQIAADATGWVFRWVNLLSGSRVSFDQGRTWQALSVPFPCTPRSVGLGGLTCGAFGRGIAPRTAISPDRGMTWQDAAIHPGYEVQRLTSSVFVASLRVPIAEDSYGWPDWWLISRDTGATWAPLFAGLNAARSTREFHAASAQQLLRVAVGEGGTLSTDGGRTWYTGELALLSAGVESFSFVSASSGWAVLWEAGADGLWQSYGLWRTVTGGRSWTRLTDWPSPSRPVFIDEQLGWRLNNGLDASTDGGQTWTVVPTAASGSPSSCNFLTRSGLLTFFDARDGFIAIPPQTGITAGGVALTRDGGRTCEPRVLPATDSPLALARAGTQGLWIVGAAGSVLTSADRGDTWHRVDVGVALPAGARWTAVHFFDVNRGWLAGTEGIAAATSDGGRTWRLQRTGLSRAIRQIEFIDARTGWMFGDDGVVVGTGTGGN